jgi:hypothetical protein
VAMRDVEDPAFRAHFSIAIPFFVHRRTSNASKCRC